MIENVQSSSDGIIRQVIVRYKHHQDNSFRFTKRSIRSLVLIKAIDDVDLMSDLGNMACIADSKIKSW